MDRNTCTTETCAKYNITAEGKFCSECGIALQAFNTSVLIPTGIQKNRNPRSKENSQVIEAPDERLASIESENFARKMERLK